MNARAPRLHAGPGARLAVAVLLATAAAPALADPAPAQAPPPHTASAWAGYPRMTLERTYAGPLQDTIIQRWRDPIDGTACYLYLPVTARHSAPLPNGFVQYGANTIGSISCTPGQAPARPPSP